MLVVALFFCYCEVVEVEWKPEKCFYWPQSDYTFLENRPPFHVDRLRMGWNGVAFVFLADLDNGCKYTDQLLGISFKEGA